MDMGGGEKTRNILLLASASKIHITFTEIVNYHKLHL
jgi:hypothetical protein